MKKIIEAFFNIGKDKYIHYTVCLVLSMLIFAICKACGLGVYSVIPAFAVPMVAGIIKEAYDKNHGGCADKGDLAADFLGTFVAMCIIALLLI